MKPVKKSTASSAREIAIDQLVRIAEARGDFNVDDTLSISSQRDHRLVKEYVQGITRWKRWLDFILAVFYKGEYQTMEPLLQWILRLGAYDLLYLRTPPHAAINEAVELAKKRIRVGAGGLVNGILRTINRNRDALPEPGAEDPVSRLGILYSHPDWMVKRWMKRYGADVEKLLEWNNQRPVYSVRINTDKNSPESFKDKLNEEGVAWEPGKYLSDFIRLPRLQPIIRGGYLKQGLCAVQDESAGLIVRLLDPRPGESVVDACAAPGGKTFYIASLMHGRGELKAFDAQPDRLERLRRTQSTYEGDWIETTVCDISVAAVDAQVDRLLLDVPCTGVGVLSKRADLRWNRQLEDLQAIMKIQGRLLEAAAEWIKVGGVLVYSTCTIEPEENEEQIQAFLKNHPHFVVETPDLPEDLLTPEGYLATIPHIHQIDGAFGARLKRVK